MAAAGTRDESWRRLPWLVPLALVLAASALIGFLRLLAPPSGLVASPSAVDVGLVEPLAVASAPEPDVTPPTAETPPPSEPPPPEPLLPEPPPPEPAPSDSLVQPEPAAPVEPVIRPATRPPLPKPPAQARRPPPRTVPAAQLAAPASRRPAAPSPAEPSPAEPPPAQPSPAPPAASPPTASLPATASRPPGVGTAGARAIFQPMPQIPDALRHRRIDTVAIVVFHVSPDGSATVELREATSDPRLNEILVEGFRRWRFFPALDHDKPVASVIELRIPVRVE